MEEENIFKYLLIFELNKEKMYNNDNDFQIYFVIQVIFIFSLSFDLFFMGEICQDQFTMSVVFSVLFQIDDILKGFRKFSLFKEQRESDYEVREL